MPKLINGVSVESNKLYVLNEKSVSSWFKSFSSLRWKISLLPPRYCQATHGMTVIAEDLFVDSLISGCSGEEEIPIQLLLYFLFHMLRLQFHF